MIDDFFENAPSGYFSFFDDGRFYVFNQTLCNLIGYSKDELKDKDVETIFTLATRIFFQTHFFPLVKLHGHAEEIFLTLLTKNKQHLPVLLNAKRVGDTTPYTSCAFIVVPNRKKFEDELVNARKVAETALKENSELIKAKSELLAQAKQLDAQIQLINQKNHELEQLNTAVTHNLNEPIRKILVYSEKMQMHGLPEGLHANIERLSRASEQMKLIVSGLQQYMSLTSAQNHFTFLDLNACFEKIANQILKENHGEEILLNLAVLPSLQADRHQIELLIYHILSNAVKFKKEIPVKVTVTGTIMKQNTFRVVENKYNYEDFLKLEIRDEGTGFDPVYKESIFELYKRLDITKGQGLGLALCKKIVENHSGSITAESRINEFTKITIFLPLKQS